MHTFRITALLIPLLFVCHADASDRQVDFNTAILNQATEIPQTLETDGDYRQAGESIDDLFDQVVAYTDHVDDQAVQFVAFARRLIHRLQFYQHAGRDALLTYLLNNDALGKELMFLIRDDNDIHGVFGVLQTMKDDFGQHLNNYPFLVAAICVVHDRPVIDRVAGEQLHAEDPRDIFEFYVRNAHRMRHDLQQLPGELLVHVVDTTATIEEMEWALNRFERSPSVGELFFRVDYDSRHFYHGHPKRVSVEGVSLQNILTFGGVCAEQTYFAMTAGKALGVPTVYTRAHGGDTSHAWVGYLDQHRGSGEYFWNFDHGRYDAYQGVRGEITHPQSTRILSDSHISFTAEVMSTQPDEHYTAQALADAAQRLWNRVDETGWPPEPLVDDERITKTHHANIDSLLELLDVALDYSFGHAKAWHLLAALAEQGALNRDQQHFAIDALLDLGEVYPDFAFMILKPVIDNRDEIAHQLDAWEWAFDAFAPRDDVRAQIRMEQAHLLYEAGHSDKALGLYAQIIEAYANAGRFVLLAVEEASQILMQEGAEARALEIYEWAWSLTRQPRDGHTDYRRQSNWYQLGRRYEQQLRQAGHFAASNDVDHQLTHTVAP